MLARVLNALNAKLAAVQSGVERFDEAFSHQHANDRTT